MRIADLSSSQSAVLKATNNRGLFEGHEKTDVELKLWFYAFQKKLAKVGVPVRVHSGFRSSFDQNVLFNKGVSKARGGQSPHNKGLAVDVIHTTRAWDATLMPRDAWSLFGAVGKEVARSRGLKLDWGGDWSFYDPAHWQFSDWRIRSAVTFEPSPVFRSPDAPFDLLSECQGGVLL